MTSTASTPVVVTPPTSVQSSRPDTPLSTLSTVAVSDKASDEGSKFKILLSLLRKFVGVADFSAVRFSLPAQLIEPIPNLVRSVLLAPENATNRPRFTQFVDRADAFVAIGQSDHELGRMLEVIRFWLTKDLKYIKGKPIKPYNSVLGEFFRCNWEVEEEQPPISLNGAPSDPPAESPAANGTGKPITVSYITEQTSHHPPISAYYIHCPERGIHAKGYDQINVKFVRGSIRVLPGSSNTGIHVCIDKHREDYQLTHPTACLNGILTRSLYITVQDSCFVTCPKTGLKAILTYEAPLISGPNRLIGVIYKYGGSNDKYTKAKDVPDNQVLVRLEGVWQEQIYYWFPSGDSKVNKNGPPADKQLLIDLVPLMPTPKILPPIEEQLPNESRRFWKDLTAAIQEKRFGDANKVKQEIEQRQRDKVADRNNRNAVWKPRFFAEVTDDGGQPHLSDEGKALLEGMQNGEFALMESEELGA
ncbi:hypothetical protein DV736_g938, partial [Chaetothyriales sp. CBS 134916]